MWYLGTDTEKIQTEDGREIWTTSSRSYITNVIETIEGFLLECGKCKFLKSNARNPFSIKFQARARRHGRVRSSVILSVLAACRYFPWDIELGRINIFH